MGKMKEFGMKLARMVYELGFNDDAIVTQHPDVEEEWLREQLKIIRANPKDWGYKRKRKKR